MKKIAISITALATITLQGCINVKMPQNGSEYRAAVIKESSSMKIIDKYEVNQPYKTSSPTIGKLATKCLSISVKHTSQDSMGRVNGGFIAHYTPTFIQGKTHSELHVQRRLEGSMYKVKQPDDGLYIFVADINAVGAKTHMEVYSAKPWGTSIVKAIKGWATGSNKGCPDMTQQ